MVTIISEEYKYNEYNYNFNEDVDLRPYQKATIHKMMERERVYKVNTTIRRGNYYRNNNYNVRNKKITLETNIGVLSNKVGSGKTFITLGLIGAKTDMADYYNNNYHFDVLYNNSKIPKEICSLINEYCKGYEEEYTFITYKKEDVVEEMNTNLIIVPHNLLNQWKEEINQRTKLRSKIICKSKDINDIDFKEMDDTDIVLCSSTQLKNLIAKVDTETHKTLWDRIFIDEVDTMNIPNFPKLKSKFLWLISTTYERILKPKNSGFIKGLFHTQHYNYDYNEIIETNNKTILPSLTLMCDQEYINKYMFLETYEKRYKLLETTNEMKLLYSIGNVIYNRAIGSNDIETIKKYIANNIRTQSIYNISGGNYNLYNFLGYGAIDNIESTYRNFIILELLNKLAICNERLLEFSYNRADKNNIRPLYKSLKIVNNIMNYYLNNNKCILCDRVNRTNKIHHKNCSIDRFHNQVIRSIDFNTLLERFEFRTRQIMNIGNLIEIGEINTSQYYFNIFQSFNYNQERSDKYNKYIKKIKNEIDERYPTLAINQDDKISRGKSKCEILMESLAEDITNGEKCLIFSDNMNFFKELSDTLTTNGVVFKVLKGNNYVIRNILKKYKNGEINVLLMNMKYCGSGLNLQMTTKIYIMNYLDESTETQVIGRANRFGRDGDLDVNYIFYDCEQKIYLQKNIKKDD